LRRIRCADRRERLLLRGHAGKRHQHFSRGWKNRPRRPWRITQQRDSDKMICVCGHMLPPSSWPRAVRGLFCAFAHADREHARQRIVTFRQHSGRQSRQSPIVWGPSTYSRDRLG
jgi:hypothetical protein